jgi:outer membrane lipoprotein-sorting protein
MVILGVGLAMAQEPATPDLPPLSPAELLARVAEQAPGTTAINGDFTWTNNLLGTTLPIPEGAEGLGAFLQSGSGRMWLQEEGARLESQTPQGDVVVVSDGATLWVYSSMQNKAWQYDLPQHQGENSSTTTSLPLDFPARVQDMIEELSSKASLEVLTERVAGRDAYVLVLTPTARNTVFGSAQVAFDAEHFVPLRAEVFSRYADDPVLAAGFTEVSFDAVDPSLFSFTPPADAQVQQKELTLPEKPAGSEGFGLGGKSSGPPALRTPKRWPASLWPILETPTWPSRGPGSSKPTRTPPPWCSSPTARVSARCYSSRPRSTRELSTGCWKRWLRAAWVPAWSQKMSRGARRRPPKLRAGSWPRPWGGWSSP